MQYSQIYQLVNDLEPPTHGEGFEALEGQITNMEIQSLLDGHLPDEVVSIKNLADWKRFFARRWERIQNSRVAYPYCAISSVNRTCVDLADLFQVEMQTQTNRFQLLMPSIVSAVSEITTTDLSKDDIALTDIVLSDDGKHFIEVSACLEFAVNDGILKHTQCMVNGKAKPLSENEAKRVLGHSKEAKLLYEAIQDLHHFTFRGLSVGALIQTLIEGLKEGGAHGGGSEKNAGAKANLAILEFFKVYDHLSEKQRWTLGMMKDRHDDHNFSYYLSRLGGNLHIKIAAILVDKGLSEEQREIRINQEYQDVETCVEITAYGFERVLASNRAALFAMSFYEKGSLKPVNFYDKQVDDRKIALVSKLTHLAVDKSYCATWMGDAERLQLRENIYSFLCGNLDLERLAQFVNLDEKKLEVVIRLIGYAQTRVQESNKHYRFFGKYNLQDKLTVVNRVIDNILSGQADPLVGLKSDEMGVLTNARLGRVAASLIAEHKQQARL